MLRRKLPFATSLLLGACFNPNVPEDAEGGAESGGGSTTGPTTTGPSTTDPTTTTPSTTAGPATDPDTGSSEGDDTSSMDEPPVIESFTVNGSTAPAEVSAGGTLVLEVEAMDDLGIASVEFFDGATSIGLVEEEPYVLEPLVTSADTGSHTYRAVVTDTGDQTAESEEVTLSVNIVGGAVEVIREQIFQGADALAIANGGTAISDDRVYLTALRDDYEGQMFGYTRDLSQLWSVAVSEVSRAPVAFDDTFIVGTTNDDTLEFVYHQVNGETGMITNTLALPSGGDSPNDLAFGAVLQRYGDNVLLQSELGELALYSSDLSKEIWTTAAGTGAFYQAADMTSDSILTAIGRTADEPDCAMNAAFCARQFRADGSVEWTVGLPPESQVRFVASRGNGGGFAVGQRSPGGYWLFTIAPDGATAEPLAIGDDADTYYLSDAHADGQGGVVVCGSRGNYATGEAFVTRFDSNGEVVWHLADPTNTIESAALDVSIADGHVYVYGLEDHVSDFLSYTGDAWLARVSL